MVDQVLHAIELDFLTGVLSEQDGVSRFDIQRHPFAILVGFAEARRQHLALLWLFLGGIRNDDSSDFLFPFLDSRNEDPVM